METKTCPNPENMTTASKGKCFLCGEPSEEKYHPDCEKMIERFQSVGLDKRYWRNVKFEVEAGNRKAYDAVKAFIKQVRSKNPSVDDLTDTNGMYIFGNAGTGKTLLVSQIVKNMLSYEDYVKHFTVSFEKVPQLTLAFRSNLDETEQIISLLKDIDVLILDDLGAEKTSDWINENLYILIDYRYSNYLPTVITSNLNLTQIGARMGDRLSSRIMGSCRIIEILTKDKRRL